MVELGGGGVGGWWFEGWWCWGVVVLENRCSEKGNFFSGVFFTTFFF